MSESRMEIFLLELGSFITNARDFKDYWQEEWGKALKVQYIVSTKDYRNPMIGDYPLCQIVYDEGYSKVEQPEINNYGMEKFKLALVFWFLVDQNNPLKKIRIKDDMTRIFAKYFNENPNLNETIDSIQLSELYVGNLPPALEKFVPDQKDRILICTVGCECIYRLTGV